MSHFRRTLSRIKNKREKEPTTEIIANKPEEQMNLIEYKR